MSSDLFKKWFSSGLEPDKFPDIPDDPDSIGNFMSDLASGLAGLADDDLISAMGILPGLLVDKIPPDAVVDALDSVDMDELEPQKRLLLGELVIDFLILDEKWEQCIPRLDDLIAIAGDAGNAEELAILFNYKGVCCYRLARYPEAVSDLAESLRLAEEIDSDRRRARARINLGLVLQEMGLLEDAAGHYRVALQLARETGDDRTLLSCYLNIGFIYIQLKRWEDGRRALEKGIELACELDETREAIRGRLNLGVLLLDKKDDLDKAVELFSAVIDEASEIGADQLVSIARLNLALALVYMDKPEESLEHSRISLQMAVDENDPEGVWRSAANLARAYVLLGEPYRTEMYFQVALDSFDRLRRTLRTDRDRSEYQKNLRNLQAEYIGFSLDARGPDIAFARLARSKSRALIDAREPGSVISGDIEEPDDAGLLTRIQRTLAEIPDSIILDYFFLEGRLMVFACDEDEVTVHECPGSESEILALTEEFRKEINIYVASREFREAEWEVDSDPPKSLIELAEIIINPVRERIKNASHLIIVPQGDLHRVPFQALADADGKYLVETHSVSVLPSSDFLETGYDSGDVCKPTKVIVLMGSGEGLEGIDREIGELKKIFAGSLEIADAGKIIESNGISGLGKILAGSDLIHFAGHAEFDRDDPYSSALLLNGGGRLKAADLVGGEIDLKNTGLVTLSACETGLSHVGSGDEMIGLARAFLATGAQSVLVSLWKISDEATAELIPAVYRELVSGYRPCEALRRSIIAILHNKRVHPYFFAPFQIVGIG